MKWQPACALRTDYNSSVSFFQLKDIGEDLADTIIWVRARIHTTRYALQLGLGLALH